MKLSAVAAFLFLLQTAPVTPPQQETPHGVIEGVVFRADTSEPVAGAQVSWTSSLEDVLNKPLRFSGSSSDAIEVTFRPGAGQISGAVIDSKSMTVSGIQAILIPEPSQRNRTELYKTVVTDQSGHFTMSNIPPGNYIVFSWEALEQNGYYNPDLIKQSEAQGLAVHIEESANASIEVKMIPASE